LKKHIEALAAKGKVLGQPFLASAGERGVVLTLDPCAAKR